MTTDDRKLEHATQNEILRTFGTRRDMRIWRMNTGAAKLKGRMVQFGVPGQADITGIVRGIRLEIEVKSPTGRQSGAQRDYQAIIERFGGIYVLARSVDDVWNAIGHLLTDSPARQIDALTDSASTQG